MSPVQAFLLGIMVAWTPSLILLAWFFMTPGPEGQPKGFDY
jgi:hypothetical protein